MSSVVVKRLVAPALVIAAAALVVWRLQVTAPQQAAELAPERARPVTVATVQRRDLAPTVSRVGRLQAARTASLRFEVAGVVADRFVEPGATVETGDPLLQLSDGDFRDAVVRAEARLAQEQAAVARDRKLRGLARQQVRLQTDEVNRLEKLGKGSLVSRSNLDAAKRQLAVLKTERARLDYSVATATARLDQMRSDLGVAQRQLERTVLRAPFPGTVNSVALEKGDYATTGSAAAEVLRASELDVYIELSIEDLGGLQPGDPVPVTVGAQQLKGRVISVQTAPDAQTLTYPVRVRVDGQGLRPGQLATVTVSLPALQQVLTVPLSALLRDENGAALWQVEDQQLNRRAIVLGPQVGAVQVVRSGVAAGAVVVTENVAALSAGQPVTLQR